jgi:uncharacterized protein with HEPN domain
MQHDDLVYVGHMLDTAMTARQLVTGRTRHAFDQDEVLRLALTHLIQVLGEAAGRVSVEYRGRHPEVPWPQIIGMRHRVVHDYLHVNQDVVWEVVSRDLPGLITVLSRIVPPG